jgi:hypothetical protein
MSNFELRMSNFEVLFTSALRHSTFIIRIFYQNSGEMHIPVFVKLLLPPRQSPHCTPQVSLRVSTSKEQHNEAQQDP